MGLDFGKSSMGNPAQAGNGLQEKNEIEVVEKYDIVADRQQMNAELVNSKEVDDIVSTIEVYNMDTIVSFGAKAAEEISLTVTFSQKCSWIYMSINFSVSSVLSLFLPACSSGADRANILAHISDRAERSFIS